MSEVTLGQANGQYVINAKKDGKEVQIPLPKDVKPQEAEAVKVALQKKLDEIDKKGVTNPQGGPQAPKAPPAPQDAGKKVDTVA